MKSNIILAAILIVGVSILGFITFYKPSSAGNNATPTTIATADNVHVENGQQIVEITAKGGYSPQTSLAKSGLPTILRVKTAGTFDCSSSISIPQLSFSTFLNATDSKDIPIPAQKPGSVINGLCGMGMYNFEIKFQ